jgi:hypothetical protein
MIAIQLCYFVQDTVAALREEVSTKELNISELKSSMKQVSLQLTVRLTFLSPSFLTSLIRPKKKYVGFRFPDPT